jgi:peptide-methionine (S)-S-oxide reductase
MKKIVFAGGCFWGVEAYFKLIDGVKTTIVGYANGHKPQPTYDEVCSKTTGHSEACAITYDASTLSLETLIDAFWRIIDPTVLNRQGPDVGEQYRTGIYYEDLEDLETILASRNSEQKKYADPIVTEIEPLTVFWDAETYHQDYLDKHPNGYCHINLNQFKKEMGK